jgi:hypothetical protein
VKFLDSATLGRNLPQNSYLEGDVFHLEVAGKRGHASVIAISVDMSAKNNRTPNVTEPILRDLLAQDKAAQDMLKITESGKSLPKPLPAELDQDPGGAFNPDHTFPQV